MQPERTSYSQICPKSGPISSRTTLPRWRQERRRHLALLIAAHETLQVLIHIVRQPLKDFLWIK